MKKLVISGCSMSTDSTCIDSHESSNSVIKNYRSYPSYIKEKKLFDIHNVSKSALDNGTIYRNLVSIVEKLLDQKILVKDIFCIVQWSGIDRHSLYSEEEKKWVLSTQSDLNTPLWINYYKNEHNDKNVLNNTLENIRKAQEFLSSHGIKYFMFTGWNIFEDTLILSDYNIDESKFWFYKSEHWNSFELNIIKDRNCLYPSNKYKTPPIKKYGGMNEWVRKNIDEKLWSRHNVGHMRDDRHPSNIAQKMFCEEIIMKLIK
tara:strand:+ start:6168 stop:6947 length:780 start_codon:yes stop_codon:yes gene_type:complete